MDPGESGSKMHGNHMPWKALTTTQVLIAMDRESPRYAGKDREPKVEGSGLPDLQSFSDVAWIYWNGLSKDPTKIRHFLSVVISNSDTQGIIGRAMRNVNSLAMTPWPGKEFSADSDNGKALLGKCISLVLSSKKNVVYLHSPLNYPFSALRILYHPSISVSERVQGYYLPWTRYVRA